MRRKFKIMYPKDHPDKDLRGKQYKPGNKKIVVMTPDGVFLLYNHEDYYPSIRRLSDVMPKYDVVWKRIN